MGEGPELGKLIGGEGDLVRCGRQGIVGRIDGEEVSGAAAGGDLAEAGFGAVFGEDEVALADEVVGVFGEPFGEEGDEELSRLADSVCGMNRV